MSDANQSEPGQPASYQVRSMVASPLPPERTYSLSSDEFQTLCDGESTIGRPLGRTSRTKPAEV
jgi:hypothetical protein